MKSAVHEIVREADPPDLEDVFGLIAMGCCLLIVVPGSVIVAIAAAVMLIDAF